MASTLPTSIVLSPKAKRALAHLEDELGVSRSNVIELAVRTLARRLGIPLNKARWFPKKTTRRVSKKATVRT